MQASHQLQDAIQLVKRGEYTAAAKALRGIATASDLDPGGRAVAWLWLAETNPERAFKIDCLERALRLKPNDKTLQRELTRLRQAPDQTQDSLRLDQAPAVLGIYGGRNGQGSGFFIDRHGIVATSAYVVGGARHVRVKIDQSRGVDGRVMRRFPLQDLALIQTTARLKGRDWLAKPQTIDPQTAFTALSFGRHTLRGAIRSSLASRESGWLRCDIPPSRLPDAGGNPLYASDGLVIGLLTRNTDRDETGSLAIAISTILRLNLELQSAVRSQRQSGYCGACGSLTVARAYGGIYCETCGASLSQSSAMAATTPDHVRLAQLYGETEESPCPKCGARVGFYAGRCLRCSAALSQFSAQIDAGATR